MKSRHRILHAIALLTAWMMSLSPGSAAGPVGDDVASVHTGAIEGALYTIAEPADWNGKLLLFAHGYRPEDEPLRAPLDTSRPLYSELLGQGWMVATTSYRRNGIIVRDAIADLDALRAHVASHFAEPRRVIVMGDSMGGVIGTLVAEERFPDYHGVLAVGAALNRVETGRPGGFSHDPRIPLLFLTNQSELEGPGDYVTWAEDATVPPALWRVGRDGHVNVNDRERLAALLALEHFVETGEIERGRDGTIEEASESTARFSARTAESTIVGVSPAHGNIFTGFVPGDLERLGIMPGDRFSLTVGDVTVEAVLGSSYDDVGEGEWIGIMRAEGVLMVARNYEDACATIGCAVGDRVTISPRP